MEQSSDCNPILFPALIRMDDKLLCTGSDFAKHLSMKHHGKNVFSIIEPIKTKKDYLWLIDAEGCYREFSELCRYRKTPKFIKPIINFTRIKYEVLAPQKIMISFVRKILKGSRGHQKDFLKVLEKHAEDDLLDKNTFLHHFMNEASDVEIEPFPKMKNPNSNKTRDQIASGSTARD